jgi:glutamine amidotransferase PdxT
MKRYLLGGIIFIGTIAIMLAKRKDFKVEQKGTIVQMRIEKFDRDAYGRKSRSFVTLGYNGRTYQKRVKSYYQRQHTVGEWVNVKYLKENTEFVTFPGETMIGDFIVLGIINLGGIWIVIDGIRKR